MPELQRILHDGVLLPFQDVPFMREEIQRPEDNQGEREVPAGPPQAIRLHRPVPAEGLFPPVPEAFAERPVQIGGRCF